MRERLPFLHNAFKAIHRLLAEDTEEQIHAAACLPHGLMGIDRKKRFRFFGKT